MRFTSKILGNYLEETRLIFMNLDNSPDIKLKLVDEGYDDTRIQVGQQLHQEAQVLYRSYLEKQQDRSAAKAASSRQYSLGFQAYITHLDRIRKEFPDDDYMNTTLDLDGRRERNMNELIEGATNFYNNALNKAEVTAKLQGIGYPVALLEQGRALVETFLGLRGEHKRFSGECQRLKVERDAAFRKLRRWIGAFTSACKAAFRDNLQTLEVLGIFVRNQARKKKQDSKTNGTNGANDNGTNTDSGAANGDTNNDPGGTGSNDTGGSEPQAAPAGTVTVTTTEAKKKHRKGPAGKVTHE